MRIFFLFFSILFSLSGFAQKRLIVDTTSIPKRHITREELLKMPKLVYDDPSAYASYSHYLRQKEKEENYKKDISNLNNKIANKILKKVSLNTLSISDSITFFSSHSGKNYRKIKIIIECDSIYDRAMKMYGMYSLKTKTSNQSKKISYDSIGNNKFFFVEKELNENIQIEVCMIKYENFEQKNVLDIKDDNAFIIKYQYKPNCENLKYLFKNNCPNCNKKDKLQKVVYGIGGAQNEQEYSGGCMSVGCKKHWYCKHCKLEF